jgi:hypothetical protein
MEPLLSNNIHGRSSRLPVVGAGSRHRTRLPGGSGFVKNSLEQPGTYPDTALIPASGLFGGLLRIVPQRLSERSIERAHSDRKPLARQCHVDGTGGNRIAFASGKSGVSPLPLAF